MVNHKVNVTELSLLVTISHEMQTVISVIGLISCKYYNFVQQSLNRIFFRHLILIWHTAKMDQALRTIIRFRLNHIELIFRKPNTDWQWWNTVLQQCILCGCSNKQCNALCEKNMNIPKCSYHAYRHWWPNDFAINQPNLYKSMKKSMLNAISVGHF